MSASELLLTVMPLTAAAVVSLTRRPADPAGTSARCPIETAEDPMTPKLLLTPLALVFCTIAATEVPQQGVLEQPASHHWHILVPDAVTVAANLTATAGPPQPLPEAASQRVCPSETSTTTSLSESSKSSCFYAIPQCHLVTQLNTRHWLCKAAFEQDDF